MADHPLQTLLNRLLHPQAAASHGAEPQDGILLRLFHESGDEAAFAALVRRHGPMILGTCRRLLRQEQDAEDAFQATFLVLARKARSLAGAASVGGWLHEVAVRVAHKSRAYSARQEKLRRAAFRPAASEAPACDDVRQAALDEELHRLADGYRRPLVLCHLEGKSVGEAAGELGWSEGAVRGRLYRGRELLRERLARRGLRLDEQSGALCPAVSARLAAAALAANEAAVVLAKGVVSTMTFERAMALAVVLAFLVGGAVLGGLALSAARPAAHAEDVAKQQAALPDPEDPVIVVRELKLEPPRPVKIKEEEALPAPKKLDKEDKVEQPRRHVVVYRSRTEVAKDLGEELAGDLGGQVNFDKEQVVRLEFETAGPPVPTLAHEIDQKTRRVDFFALRQAGPIGLANLHRVCYFAITRGASVRYLGVKVRDEEGAEKLIPPNGSIIPA